jgi:DNA-directed RNA polymerase subunit RPC12/RpoP
MKYTCPKCGKKIELSTEVLINNEYKAVCPQCLSRLQIIGDYAYIPDKDIYGNVQTSKPGKPIDVVAEEVTTTPPPPVMPRKDPLYHDAVRYLMTCTHITPQMLCTQFGITQERAVELLRQLEDGGIVGPTIGGIRQIMIPHRSVYEPQRPFTGQRSYGPTQQPRPVAGTGKKSHFKWFLILIVIFAILQTCG